jgi:hypothetical protein
MTVIIGANFNGEILLVSDSRATVSNGTDSFASDNLQKIIAFDENHLAAYATNDLNATKTVLSEYQHYLNENKSANLTDKTKTFSEFCLATYKLYNKSFVFLLAIRQGDEWLLYEYDSPLFESKRIETISIQGSGSYIRVNLEEFYQNSISPKSSIIQKANAVVRSMMASLSGPNSSTIGGLPQALVLTKGGLKTIHSGYVNFSPEGEPDSKQILYKNGGWVQQDGAKHTQLAIISPEQIDDTNLSEQIFYNYEKTAKKEIKWYLNSFGLFLDVEIDHSKTNFGMRLGSLMVLEFPQEMDVVLYISAFGPSTEHQIEVTLVNPSSEEQILFANQFDNTKFPNEIEFIEKIKINVEKRGKHYLVCRINGAEIGRKVLYFYEPRDPENIQLAQSNMVEFLNGYADPLISPHLSLLTLSGLEPKLANNHDKIEIDDQFSQIYYNNYPVNIDFYLLAIFQANPGKYTVAFDFIDAIDQSVIISGEIENESTSITNSVPVFFKMNPAIHRKGFYFFRVYINSKLIGAMPFFADGHPEMTYELTDADAKLVDEGGLLKFVKRPVDLSDQSQKE